MSIIQDIFREYYLQFQETHKVSFEQDKAAENIMDCRSESLGQCTYKCKECGHSSVRYHSCRNRHCPTCQGLNKEIWVDKRKKDILNAPYFHVVFTMPKQLHPVIYQNQRLLYDLMYKAVAETLTELSADPKHLGAQIGFFSILHTWGQNLYYHPHIHTVVLAGGLTKEKQWRKSSKKFFIPVKVLSALFRGKFMSYLKQYYKQNQLIFVNKAKKYEDPKQWKNLVDECYSLDWYSYSKKTFEGPYAVMKYLGRYTHRIAISNQRILSVSKDTVTIGVKDYKNNNRKTQVTMKKREFIRRFLMHVLPKGFVKIRYYGILANRNRQTKLSLCRILTNSPLYEPRFEGLNTIQIMNILLGRDITMCPGCKKGHLEMEPLENTS